jgi:Rps23 Pro-64 3,4-dihydroxylase Tpa1-like proline 4-hydroxylase
MLMIATKILSSDLNQVLNTQNYRYFDQYPYPFVKIDNFLDDQYAEEIFDEFPTLNSSKWINYKHFNENKFGNTKLDSFPPKIKELIICLNSEEFTQKLSEFTGINGLIPDPSLEGGGLHQTPKDGFLNIHADFTAHPHQKTWRRRVNLLIYLNKYLQPEWGGDLEIWEKDMSKCVHKIAPIFNRCVIFNTDSDTFHGHPDPFNCPEGESRKSIALYYFTDEKNELKVKGTDYKSRPTDSIMNRFLIFIDKKILSIYHFIKVKTGMSDAFVSKFLGFFNKNKK